MYDLTKFTLKDMIECGAALRELGAGAQSMEEVASRIVRYLYDHLIDQESGDRACRLVRFFKTHSHQGLDVELQEIARHTLGDLPVFGEMKCLTLMGSAGDRPEWNSRHNSARHKVVPLPSPEFIARYPMISQLIEQTGLELTQVLRPDPALLMELEQKTYNVFHVPEALGSQYVPDQEGFVIPFGVESVLGMSGVFPSGDLFAIILFCRFPVPRETADMFRTLALNAKMAVLPYDGKAVFAGATIPTPVDGDAPTRELAPLRSEVAALSQLLEVSERAMLRQSSRLQQALEDLSKRAAELQETNQTLEALIQASPLPIIALSPDTNVQMWNPAAEEVFGWNQEEVIGLSYPLVPDDSQDEFKANMKRLLEGESFVGVELRRQKKDGSPIDIGVWTAPVRDANGEIHCLMVLIEDLTERKQSAKALQESDEQVRLLLNSTGEAIYGVDLDGSCTFCNPACVDLLGYDDVSALLGKNMHELIHHSRPDGEFYPREDCRIYQAFLQGDGTHVEDECLWRSDGSSFPAEYWSYPIHRDSEIVVAVVAFVDITERRQAESAFQELSVLEERNRLARELHDSVAQLIYGTNLMAEAGRRFAATGNLDQVMHYLGRSADTSRQALKEMRLLVNELRPLALEHGGIVSALRQRLDSVEKRAGIDVQLICDESLALPSLLEDELFRIAQEALNNSLKHAGATSTVVRITAQEGEVELEVEDNGKGFDPSAVANKGGIGLLSIRQRVQNLDGSLAILSAPGEGTKVKVTVAGGWVSPAPLTTGVEGC